MSRERIALLDVERAASASALDADADEGASTRDRQHPSTSRRVVLATLTTCALLAAGSAATRGRLDWSDIASSLPSLGQGVTGGAKSEGNGYPIFLHIPKAGGTTIENALGKLGIRVGYCHPKPRPYALVDRFRNYEAWHTPPVGAVENSWAIVRDPYDRAQSEFRWASTFSAPAVYHSLNPGYSAHNCKAFQSWVQNHMVAVDNPLRKCYAEGGYSVDGIKACNAKITTALGVGSHWIPQSIMAASATTVFHMEDCMSSTPGTCKTVNGQGSQPNILSYMRANYKPNISLDDLYNEWHHGVEKPDLGSCWSGFDPKILAAFNEAYKSDFTNFGYQVKTPRQGEGSGFDATRQDSTETLGQVQQRLGHVLQENMLPHCGG